MFLLFFISSDKQTVRGIRCVLTTAVSPVSQAGRREDKPPDLEDFLAKRDYVGAITLLEFKKQANAQVSEELLLLLVLATLPDLTTGLCAGQRRQDMARIRVLPLWRARQGET